MTGTAKTEEKEFQEIYNLSVVEIPTNEAVARQDRSDFIYKTKEAKYAAAINDIKERYANGQPVLVGTISVDVSEHLSRLLERQGIPHSARNAKQQEREAEIIKNAGQRAAVTIATNMAGRGVDIKLGDGVGEAGGLYVLGPESHEGRSTRNKATWSAELVARVVLEHTENDYQEEWDLNALFAEMATLYETEIEPDELRGLAREELVAEFHDDAGDAYEAKEEQFGPELMREIERYLVLQVVDTRWREHLDSMEYLRDGIHLRAMAQKDPLVEYRAEGHTMFEELGASIREEGVRYLFHIETGRQEA